MPHSHQFFHLRRGRSHHFPNPLIKAQLKIRSPLLSGNSRGIHLAGGPGIRTIAKVDHQETFYLGLQQGWLCSKRNMSHQKKEAEESH